MTSYKNIDWRIAALGVLAIMITLAITPMSWLQLLANLTAVALLASAQRWPILSGLAMVALFVFISGVEDARGLAIILSAPFLVSLIAMVGRPRFAAGIAVAIGYISSTSPFTGRWIPNDFTSVAVYVVALTAGWWGGIYLRRQRLQHAAHQQQLRNELEERRERLAQVLHDSVATTLTSVVMRAETLALTSIDNEQARETAEHIADETRQAMQEVRHLLHFMQENENVSAPILNRTIGEQIAVTTRPLVSHGFIIEGADSARSCDWSFPPGFEQVFTELSTNAIKYAVPGSVIEMRINKEEAGLRCTMRNTVRAARGASHLSSQLGLQESRSVVSRYNGTFNAHRIGQEWVVEFTVPEQALRC
ncbi:histidine kinase [Corynebacterium lipophiloflavum DSM 44291]|uniref:histidine kinase n=1 Tax=Corynebacterium lipophiloflavum (strain ATCC 700352 / DSM 44291 / CCUG 37336 / JCM 10383 / DMMZ 1944) TaxID=525263 RepID=C0XPS7_CORLD|nr:histidine kinase [Corynebacterium lipophiloflavum DSM 44291]